MQKTPQQERKSKAGTPLIAALVAACFACAAVSIRARTNATGRRRNG